LFILLENNLYFKTLIS